MSGPQTSMNTELQPGADWRDLLSLHGTLYVAGFTWKPRPGETSTFSKRWYFSEEERNQATAETLMRMGYEKPRWWQYWRWGEMKLSKGVADILGNT